MGPFGTCILARDGIPRCFGLDTLGRFGVDESTLTSMCGGVPCVRAGSVHLGESSATSVALGETFTCVVTDGVATCRGGNAFGTLGRGVRDRDAHTLGLAIDAPIAFTRLVAGRAHVCGLTTTDGRVACWGLGSHGQLGRDPATLDDCGTPADATEAGRLYVDVAEATRCSADASLVAGLTGVTDLRAGPFATCAYASAAGWRCFGRHVDGSLGVASADVAVWSPTSLVVADVHDVALGPTHGCVVDGLGRTYCFGQGELGQLGLGASIAETCTSGPCALTPARVADAATATAVVVGDAHSCVLLTTGAAACFGSDAVGQVGDSSTAGDDCGGVACAPTPHAVVYGGRFTRLIAVGDATCGNTVDDHLVCWGDGTRGELGDGAASVQPFPGEVYGIP